MIQPNLFVSYSIAVKGLPVHQSGWIIIDGNLGKIACREDVTTLAKVVQEEAIKIFGPAAKSSIMTWQRLET